MPPPPDNMTAPVDIEALLTRHRRLIERLCIHASLGEPKLAAELLEECYVALWRRQRSLRRGAKPAEVRAWVVWVCRGTIHRYRHNGHHHLTILDDYMADSIVAPDDLGAAELLDELAASLGARDKLILSLMLEGYSASEIAERLMLHPENAKTLRRRLIERLQQAYEKIINQS